MRIFIRTNKATANIFGLHTQPRKTTGYTNILKLVWGGGKGKRAEKSIAWPKKGRKTLVDLKKRSTKKVNKKPPPPPRSALTNFKLNFISIWHTIAFWKYIHLALEMFIFSFSSAILSFRKLLSSFLQKSWLSAMILIKILTCPDWVVLEQTLSERTASSFLHLLNCLWT